MIAFESFEWFEFLARFGLWRQSKAFETGHLEASFRTLKLNRRECEPTRMANSIPAVIRLHFDCILLPSNIIINWSGVSELVWRFWSSTTSIVSSRSLIVTTNGERERADPDDLKRFRAIWISIAIKSIWFKAHNSVALVRDPKFGWPSVPTGSVMQHLFSVVFVAIAM